MHSCLFSVLCQMHDGVSRLPLKWSVARSPLALRVVLLRHLLHLVVRLSVSHHAEASVFRTRSGSSAYYII